MFNCPCCWENPCICGQEYQTWSNEKIKQQIEMFEKILQQRKEKEIRFLNIEESEKLQEGFTDQ